MYIIKRSKRDHTCQFFHSLSKFLVLLLVLPLVYMFIFLQHALFWLFDVFLIVVNCIYCFVLSRIIYLTSNNDMNVCISSFMFGLTNTISHHFKHCRYVLLSIHTVLEQIESMRQWDRWIILIIMQSTKQRVNETISKWFVTVPTTWLVYWLHTLFHFYYL